MKSHVYSKGHVCGKLYNHAVSTLHLTQSSLPEHVHNLFYRCGCTTHVGHDWDLRGLSRLLKQPIRCGTLNTSMIGLAVAMIICTVPDRKFPGGASKVNGLACWPGAPAGDFVTGSFQHEDFLQQRIRLQCREGCG